MGNTKHTMPRCQYCGGRHRGPPRRWECPQRPQEPWTLSNLVPSLPSAEKAERWSQSLRRQTKGGDGITNAQIAACAWTPEGATTTKSAVSAAGSSTKATTTVVTSAAKSSALATAAKGGAATSTTAVKVSTAAKVSTLAATSVSGTAVAVTTTAKAGTLAGTTAATGGVMCALVPLCVAAGSCAASMALLSHLPSKQKKRNPAWNQRAQECA